LKTAKKSPLAFCKKAAPMGFLLIINFNYKNQIREDGKEQALGSSRHTTVPCLHSFRRQREWHNTTFVVLARAIAVISPLRFLVRRLVRGVRVGVS
jgi:hypothetical protein